MLGPQQQDEQSSSERSPGDDSEHAGPTRDRNDSAEALSPIEKRLRESTHRLADLNVLFMESEAETPGRKILQTEFYFARPVIRSAVIHRCASEGGRQYAMAWLFEHAEADPKVHLPAGEVTVSANGKVYVSAGCPIDYPFRPQARTVNHRNARAAVAAPEAAVGRMNSSPAADVSTSVPRRQHAPLVWVPLFLLVILAGSVFLYRYLIAPALAPSETAAARPEYELPTVVTVEQENRIEPELDAGTPEPPPLVTDEPVLAEEEPAASDDELPAPLDDPPASTRHGAVAEQSAPASRPRLSQGRTAASERRSVRRPDADSRLPPRSSKPVPPLQASPSRAPAVAAAPPANAPSPAAADPPTAVGGTQGGGVKTTQPVAKEKPAPPAVAREAQPAPAPAVKRQRQQVAVENTWLTRMRAELVKCGKPGFWRNDICREVTRWRHCHPDRWHTVVECKVESFPEPLSSVISRPRRGASPMCLKSLRPFDTET